MPGVRIAAEPRTEFGKGAARRVRRAAKVPAVLYGHGEAPRHFSLPGHELMLALRSDPNALIALQTADGEQLALPKSVVRDPIKGFLEHVDLVAVRRGEKVTVDVPVTLTGEVAGDAIVELQTTALTVEADATSLPEAIEVDVAGLEVGAPIHASDIALPEGVTLVLAPETVVVQATAAPTAEAVEADLAASDAETGAGVSDSGETQASDVEAGEGTDDIVPETEGAQAGPADGPADQA